MNKRKLDTRQQVLFGFPDEDLKTSQHDEIVLWLKRNGEAISRKLIRWTETWDPNVIESIKTQAAATVATRMDLLRETLTKEKWRLERVERGEFRLYLAQDLEKRIESMNTELTFLSSWNGLGEPPAPKLDVRCELEHPVLRRPHEASDIAGFIDVVLSVRALRLTAGIVPSDDYGRPYLGIDAKTYADWNARWSDFRRFAFDAKTTIPSLGQLIRQFKAYRAYSKLPLYAVSPDARFANEICDEGFGFIKYPDGIITLPKFVR